MRSLSTDQLDALSTVQVASLGSSRLASLSSGQIDALPTGQSAARSRTGIAGLGTRAAVLTDIQLMALATAKQDRPQTRLNADQFAATIRAARHRCNSFSALRWAIFSLSSWLTGSCSRKSRVPVLVR